MREIDRISPGMLAVFEKKGYLQNDMIAFALSDMNAERVRTDNGILLTEHGLAEREQCSCCRRTDQEQ